MVFDWKSYDTFLSKFLVIFRLSPKINVILVDFSQEILWPEATKSDPHPQIDYNGEQNLVECHTHQDLVYLLQVV